jgi:hypothetical protein
MMKNKLDEKWKELIMPILRYELDELRELIDQVEKESHVESDFLKNYFFRRSKNEKQILKSLSS